VIQGPVLKVDPPTLAHKYYSEERVATIRQNVQGLLPFEHLCLKYIYDSISKCLIQMPVPVIHPTGQAKIQKVIQVVNALRFLPCRPHKSAKYKIEGNVWVLRGEITKHLLHNDVSIDCNGDDDAKVQNKNSQAAFGANNSAGKYFVSFCNLVNILHAGPAAATKVKIQIRGFLRLEKVTALTVLENLLLYLVCICFSSRKVDRCQGDLFGNNEYELEGCRREPETSQRLLIQITGDLGSSNNSRAVWNCNRFVCCATISESPSQDNPTGYRSRHGEHEK
jgi:hypothetical protein